jgi:hypothetical protein
LIDGQQLHNHLRRLSGVSQVAVQVGLPNMVAITVTERAGLDLETGWALEPGGLSGMTFPCATGYRCLYRRCRRTARGILPVVEALGSPPLLAGMVMSDIL